MNCIEWNKAKDRAGYGVSWLDGKWIRVHRKVYIQTFGPIPSNLVVRHICDNRSCVNPEHLVLGTHKQNSLDMVERNRQAKGEQVGTSKLTTEIVSMIRSMSGSARQIASFIGCSSTTVKDIKNKKYWKHV